MIAFWYLLPLLSTCISSQGVCTNDICHSNGQCHVINSTNFNCVCQKCFTGERCEFPNNIVSLSLTSSILADIIRNGSTEAERNTKRNVYVVVGSIFVLVCLISNFLSLHIFLSRDKNGPEHINIFGDNRIFLSLYCLYAIMVGLELQSRLILMFFDHCSSASYKYYSCNIAPVVSTLLIHLGLWLSASITVERTLFHLYFIEVINSNAKKRTLIINFLLVIIVGLSHIHEIFGRRALPNFVQPNRFVCSFDYDKEWLKTLDFWVSTLHLAIPCFIHLVCVILELWRIDRLKFLPENQNESRSALWLSELNKKRSRLIPPLLIIICCLPHFIFAHLIYHCIESSQHRLLHLHIALNLFVFVPQAITFFIYVLPSKDYMAEFRTTICGRLFTCQFCGEQQQHSTDINDMPLRDVNSSSQMTSFSL